MVKLLVIINFIFTIKSFQNNEKIILEGNWFYCDPIEGYIELHFYDSTLEWCPEINPTGTLFKYKLHSDTLIITHNTGEVHKGIIKNCYNNKIEISYFEDELFYEEQKIIIFNKMNESNKITGTISEIKRKNRIEKKYLQGFQNRMKKYKCGS